MPRKSTTPEQRQRRIEEKDEKRKADEVAAEDALDGMIQRSIEKHGP
jgi:hypothetical protein